MGCAERQGLAGKATEALHEVSRITEQLIAAVRDADPGLVNPLYSQLQAAEQELDARIEVLWRHDRDHRCVALFAGEQK